MIGLKDVKKVNLNGETVYLKKGKFAWRVIHPWKNEDGSTNYFNVFTGGWGNLIKVLIYIIFAVLIYFGMTEITNQCEQTLALCTEECPWLFTEGGILNG